MNARAITTRSSDGSLHIDYIVDPEALAGQNLTRDTAMVPFDQVKHLLSDKPLHRPRRQYSDARRAS